MHQKKRVGVDIPLNKVDAIKMQLSRRDRVTEDRSTRKMPEIRCHYIYNIYIHTNI